MDRLLCIVGSLNAGGAETFLMKVYRSLDRSKYQMDFCVANPDEGIYKDEIESMGGRIYLIPYKSKGYKQFKDALFKVVKEGGYKNVLRITSNAAGFIDLKIAKEAGATRCIARSSNSSDGECLASKVINDISRLLFMKYVDVKVAPSDLAAIYTFGKKSVASGKVQRLNNAVDLNVFHYTSEGRKKIREEFSLGSVPVIGHVGRFMQQKNHKFLIDVFAEIRKQKDAKLLLVGKGELEKEIRDQVNNLGLTDYVIFTGIRKDIPDLMSAMDVMIFPSFYEGMPNTVIEAQATGLPCVISNSITKEANITHLVRYENLAMDQKHWADVALDSISPIRKDTKLFFEQNDYTIESVSKRFINLMYGVDTL